MKILAILIMMMMSIHNNTTDYHRYATTTVVTEIDYATDTVICEDSNGYEWAFYGVEDWCIGDVCSMVMCDNGTPSILDDTIESVKYSCYVIQ
jgi:hypothetical protein